MMPPVPLVDAHLHLWDPGHFRMAWLDGNALLHRTFDLADFMEDAAGIPLSALVYVQVEVEPAYAYLEAAWAARQAAMDNRLQGVVAWAPLEYGQQARAFLQSLRALGPSIKGVRRIIEFEPDPAFCLRPDFVRGVNMLPEFGFSFDININYRHLANTIALVRQCPATSFVLDHLGKPGIAAGLLQPWREQITELVSFPNVCCKLSGMVTEADHRAWTTDDLAPFAEHVLTAFGEDRVLFGGDWPVVLQAAAYRQWVETAAHFIGRLSPAAQRKVWAENARRFYHLD